MAQAKSKLAAPSRLQNMLSSRYAVLYALVLPAFILRMIYSILPIIQTAVISLTDRTIMSPGRYIGLRNYAHLAQDATLIGSLGWTLLYTGAAAAAETIIGLGIAVLLMQKLRLRWLSNFIMLLPWVVAPILAAVAFQILYFEDGGILNEILRQLGFGNTAVRWLSDAETARFSVIAMSVWKNVSWVALIFMAAIGSLSKEVLEAAAVDGANALQRFWHVTLPLLKPAIYLVLLLRAMAEVQTFEQIYGLTRGGPGGATKTLALYAFERFFQQLRYGYGSAVNIVLLLVTIAIGGVFAWLLYRSREH